MKCCRLHVDMASLFTKIISGDIPCYKVYEDDRVIAFLDISPVSKGHTLVVPKEEVDLIWSMKEEDYFHLLAVAKKIAVAMEKAIPCKRVGMAVIGLEVPHVHIHLTPMSQLEDITFNLKRLSFTQDEFEKIVGEIKSHLE